MVGCRVNEPTKYLKKKVWKNGVRTVEKPESLSGVNSKRLKFARNHYNFSFDYVSKKTNIKIDELEKFENGDSEPDYLQ